VRKSIHERVRALLAQQEKARSAAEYKAGEHERRLAAGRFAASVRADKRIDALLDGRVEPRSLRELQILDRAEFGE
jgi:hypothetical protein